MESQKPDILDFISQYTELKRQGKWYVGRCPLHDDRNPSFGVNPKTQTWTCFSGCGGGSVVEFVRVKYYSHLYDKKEGYKRAYAHLGMNNGSTPSYVNPAPPRRKPTPAPKPLSYIPDDLVRKTLSGYAKNAFVQGLRQVASQAEVKRVLDTLKIGTTKDGSTLFWYIDQAGRVRTAKRRKYELKHLTRQIQPQPKSTGRLGDTKFIPKELIKKRIIPAGEYEACWYGEHQLPARPDDIVCVVEGEKGVAYGTLFLPEFVWIALGGTGTSGDRQVLQNRNVLLWPDNDQAGEQAAQRLANELTGIAKSVRVIDLVEHFGEGEPKWDLVDFLLKQPTPEAPTPEPEQASPPKASPSEPERTQPEPTPEPENELQQFERLQSQHLQFEKFVSKLKLTPEWTCTNGYPDFWDAV